MTLSNRLARWTANTLPRRVAYWVLIRCMSEAIKPYEEVPAVPATDVLARWGNTLPEAHR